MKLVSLNVGKPRNAEWNGKVVRTGIFKSAVAGPVRVATLGLEGDGQADLKNHGGPDKAVYGYPHEHDQYWRQLLGDYRLTYGNFGENLTTDGLLETAVRIGDRYRIGSAILEVKQPRIPCSRLQVRFQRADIVDLFYASRRFGFYFSVVQEGVIEAGDDIFLVHSDPAELTISEMSALHAGDTRDPVLIERALASKALSQRWQIELPERIKRFAKAEGAD